MGAGKREYEVILSPKGQLTTEDDEKRLIVESHVETVEEFRETVDQEILRKKLIDPTSFRKYWAVSSVTENTTNEATESGMSLSYRISQVRKTFLDTDSKAVARAVRKEGGGYVLKNLPVYSSPGPKNQEHVRLAIKKDMYDDFRDVYEQLYLKHAVGVTNSAEYFSEAILRAIAAEDSVRESILTDEPIDWSEAIARFIIKNPAKVEDNL